MANGTEKRRRGLPLALAIVLVVLLPLAGLLRSGKAELDDARDAAEAAAEVDALVEDAVAHIELRNALLRESSWRLILLGLEQVGLTPAMVTELTGLQPNSELDDAVENVDRLADAIGDRDLSESIEELRRDLPSSVADIASVFGDLSAAIAEVGDQYLLDLLAASGESADADSLIGSVQVLIAASDAQRAMAGATTAQFGARFGDIAGLGVGGEDRKRLLFDLALYAAAAAELDRLELPLAVREQWTAIQASDDFATFTTSMDALVSDIVAAGDGVGTNPIAELPASARLLTGGTNTVDAHDELVRRAADDVRASARQRIDAAEGAARSTTLWAAAFVASTLLLVLGVARFIVLPARRLAAGAERIEHGDVSVEIAVSGPSELRNATRALNNTSAALDHIEHQARRLADPSLDLVGIDDSLSGPLSDSLRQAMERLARSITDRETLRFELAHLASHDDLTALANRRATLDRLEEAVARAQRGGASCAALFIDLDGFKEVNDELGHTAGDLVLRVLAERIAAVLRAGDLVGRLGGDEFLVVADPVADVGEAKALAERIVSVADAPIETANGIAAVGASVGIAVSGTDTASELLARADEAVYAAKAQGKGCVVVAESTDDQPVR